MYNKIKHCCVVCAIVIVSIFFISVSIQGGNLYASSTTLNMRKCLLLPITDGVDGAIAYKVFLELENFLKESDWCYYRGNSNIIDILGNYRKNLKSHLQNKNVLEVIAGKSDAGSLIRIDIQNEMQGAAINFEVIGNNGEDIYFKEKVQLSSDDLTLIVDTIKNWLDLYKKTIPYNGQITGIIGNQFTVDIGRDALFREGDSVKIVRPVGKKKHPLFNEVVEWDAEEIANGQLIYVDKNQSQGKALSFAPNKFLRMDDWVRVQKKESNVEVEGDIDGSNSSDGSGNANSNVNSDKLKNEEERNLLSSQKENFGQLGKAGVSILLSDTLHTINDNGQTAKIGAFVTGVNLQGELWISREYYAVAEISRKFGTFKRRSGTFVQGYEEMGITGTNKFAFGYKYLPLGFFYGPQLNAHLGYSRYDFGFNNSVSKKVVGNSYSGIMVGLKGDMPLKNSMRIFMQFDFIPMPSYQEDETLFGSPSKVSVYDWQIGGNFQYFTNFQVEGAVQIISANSEFENASRELSSKETIVKAGLVYTF